MFSRSETDDFTANDEEPCTPMAHGADESRGTHSMSDLSASGTYSTTPQKLKRTTSYAAATTAPPLPLADSLEQGQGGGIGPISRLYSEHVHVHRIGSGSFGEVVRAVCELDQRPYAIKTSSKSIQGEGDLQQRLQEAYTASVCANPYLLRYYECWVEDSKLSIRTELVSGGNIQSRIVKGRCWPQNDVLRLLQQIGVALHWLHSAGIAHLDVKPENIMVTECEGVGTVFKLGDFGLARRVMDPLIQDLDEFQERYRGENDDEGDHRYLCPALLKVYGGTTQWNKEADIYSLGASVVELMGGEPGQVRSNVFGPYFDTYSSEQLRQLVRRMCAEYPPDRPSALEIVETAVRIEAETDPKLRQDVDEGLERRRRMHATLSEQLRELEHEVALLESQ